MPSKSQNAKIAGFHANAHSNTSQEFPHDIRVHILFKGPRLPPCPLHSLRIPLVKAFIFFHRSLRQSCFLRSMVLKILPQTRITDDDSHVCELSYIMLRMKCSLHIHKVPFVNFFLPRLQYLPLEKTSQSFLNPKKGGIRSRSFKNGGICAIFILSKYGKLELERCVYDLIFFCRWPN